MAFPMVDLIETAHVAVDDLLKQRGRITIDAGLEISVRNIAGERHRGIRGDENLRHGRQQQGFVAQHITVIHLP